ncbi:MAG: hypothetical protein ACJAXX_002172 [Roseivirga sp.]|jgi:hypothetical protein
MDLTNLATLTDLLKGLVVIASLLFIDFKIRANTKERKLKNLEAMIDIFISHHATLMSKTNSVVSKKVRNNFSALTAPEKIIFDALYYNTILGYEVGMVNAQNQIHKKDLLDMPSVSLKDLFSFLGAKQWYLQKDNPYALAM